MGSNKCYEELKPYLEKMMAMQTAQVLFSWDTETLAPKEASPYTAKVIGILSEEYFRTVTDEKLMEIIGRCRQEGNLTEMESAVIREVSEEAEKLSSIPPEEYREFAELTANSTVIWAKARKEKG